MDNETLQLVVDEILPVLLNRIIGKIFQPARNQLVIDFRPGDGRYLLLNFEPAATPRVHLVRRRVRDLEKESESSNFALFVRKRLSNAVLNNISKDADDRIVRFVFLVETETGGIDFLALVAQFTGRAANLFLVNAENEILDSLRDSEIENQRVGEIYAAPTSENNLPESSKPPLYKTIRNIESAMDNYEFTPPSPLSLKLDSYFSKLEAEREYETNAALVRSKLKQDLGKKEKLLQRLHTDLTRHGDAETLKKHGDLLLANAATARRGGNQIFVIDYFDENAPEIIIEADENLSLPEAAAKLFAKYAKARNAAVQLTERVANLKIEIADLRRKNEALQEILARKDAAALEQFALENELIKPKSTEPIKQISRKEPEITSGVRVYRSSDGMEILVGRNSADNDYLTMRVAKSLDWWMHAADYPGSHVVIRNPSKRELPQKTLIEAAQLAAKFSQARADSKVAVNYTQKKFVSKPKGAAVGMVRLASFRTILVEPNESGTRILK